jgi:PAS domain S-box-containing protein
MHPISIDQIDRGITSRTDTKCIRPGYGDVTLTESVEVLKAILANTHDVIFQLSPTGYIQYINPKVREIYGYEPEELIGKHFNKTTPVTEIPKALKVITAVLSGKTVSNFEIDQIDAGGKIVHVEINSTPVKKDGKVIAIQGVMRDITTRKQAEEEVNRSTQQLVSAVESTIQAMAVIVEMRDPYTAGHQRRVTELACTIAVKMGLSEDQITGLRLAGLIHDVGKIRVPTEILTNLDGLSEAEFNIIKTHPQVGYDVLRTIDLPWPVATIVHQHHERMDGSGYPFGVFGKDIIQEARILAVADVVETIASHRPYRSAFGIDKALDEISEKNGILYDSQVVGVCLQLFKEGIYNFE